METLHLNKKSKISGSITLPGSKSLSNRALLLSAVARGTTRLHNLLRSDDTSRMIDALKALGVNLYEDGDAMVVEGIGSAFKCDAEKRIVLDLGNAGTAMRPLCAMLSISEGCFELTGEVRMMERPIGPLSEALKTLGLSIEYLNNPGFPPLLIHGSQVKNHEVHVDGSTSSQFISALLMAAPLCGGLTIRVDGDLISKPYVDLTIALIEKFGAKVTRQGYRSFTVAAGDYVSPVDYLVEGDASGATYFCAAAAIAGEITVNGIGEESTQGDINFLKVLEMMGAKVERFKSCVKVYKAPELLGIDIDMNNMPDAAMTLVPMALYTKGKVRITNIASWRVKETDRIAAMVKEMSKLGVKVNSGEDFIEIDASVRNQDEVTFDTYNDHRMAMSMSLAVFDRDININDPECTKKTFPDYFGLFSKVCE